MRQFAQSLQISYKTREHVRFAAVDTKIPSFFEYDFLIEKIQTVNANFVLAKFA